MVSRHEQNIAMMCYNKRHFFGAKNTKDEGKSDKETPAQNEDGEGKEAAKDT